jgi:hypothetical protein
MNIFTRLYRTSSKAGLIVTPFLHEVIIGKMLGDLHAERPSPKHNTRLSFKQSIVQNEYISHLWQLFSAYCTSPPIIRAYLESRENKAPFTKVSRFNTCSLACFNIYRVMFYVDGVKIIPSDIGEHITAVSLAYFFMDDGYKSRGGFYFCTESFTAQDLGIFLLVLHNKFWLDATLHSTGRVYIMSTSRDLFISLVKPHMLPMFYYKLG